jgi:hypothetical protein
MSNNSIVPAALANTAETEVQVFSDYLATAGGEEILAAIEAGYGDLWNIQDIKSAVKDSEDATAIMSFIDEAISYSEGIAVDLHVLREGYARQLGVPAALNKVAADLRHNPSKELADALRYGLKLMWNSTAKAPKEFCEALIALGMPKTNGGYVANSYRRISYCTWVRELLNDVSGHTEAVKQIRAAHGNARDLKDAIDGSMALLGMKRDASGKWVKDGETL